MPNFKTKLRLQEHFIYYSCLGGLILWGAPAIALYPSELGFIFSFVLLSFMLSKLFFLERKSTKRKKNIYTYKREGYVFSMIIVFALLYIAIDSLIGRQNLMGNFLLSSDSVSTLVDAQNNEMGQGRGFWELLATILIFLPFFLYDLINKLRLSLRIVGFFVVFLLIFYELEASRGYLVVAMASIYLANKNISFKQLFFALFLMLLIFLIASSIRGDFDDTSFNNPIFSGIFWPFINLGMYLNSYCGESSTAEFILQTFQKIIPSFLMDKNIISFNINASECIYDMTLDELGAVSVFTYLGELTYYSPGWLTAILAGSMLGIATNYIDKFLRVREFYATQIFIGLWLVVLLRSRILDVFSYILALAFFIILIQIFRTAYLRYIVPMKRTYKY